MSTRLLLRPLILAGCTLAGVIVGLAVHHAVAGNGGGDGWGDGDYGGGLRGSGVTREEARTVEAFDAVQLDGAFDVDITVGPPRTVRVEADDNLLDRIDTRVRGHALVIDSRGSYSSRHRMVVHVSTPTLERAQLDGSGDIAITGLAGGSLRLGVGGSGDIRADGRVDRLEAEVEGSGDLRLAGLDAREARVRLDGSGDIEIGTSEALDATLSGSGDIRYHGHPASLSRSVSGSGEIHGI